MLHMQMQKYMVRLFPVGPSVSRNVENLSSCDAMKPSSFGRLKFDKWKQLTLMGGKTCKINDKLNYSSFLRINPKKSWKKEVSEWEAVATLGKNQMEKHQKFTFCNGGGKIIFFYHFVAKRFNRIPSNRFFHCQVSLQFPLQFYLYVCTCTNVPLLRNK